MPDVAETVAKQLATEIESRGSVELRVQCEIERLGDASQASPVVFDTMEEHYIESGIGQRYSDVTSFLHERPVRHHTHYDDTDRSIDVNYEKDDLTRQTTAIIKHEYYMEHMGDRMERPHPLQLLYVGRKPLHEALPDADYLGPGNVLDRACEVFLFRQVRWGAPQDHVYFLDKQTALPLKVEAYDGESARQQGQPLWVWEADSFDQVEGHFIPLESTLTAYSPQHEEEIRWTFEVEEAKFNQDIPASTFTPALQPGINVLDAINSRTYKQPGVVEKVDRGTDATVGVSPPLRALPERTWTQSISGATLALGVIILVIAGTRWWRNR